MGSSPTFLFCGDIHHITTKWNYPFDPVGAEANCVKVWCFPAIRLSEGLCRVDSLGLRSEMKLILWPSKPVNRNVFTSQSASFSFLQLSQRFGLRALDLCADTSHTHRLSSRWKWNALPERNKREYSPRIRHLPCLRQIYHQTGLHQSLGWWWAIHLY